MRIDYDLAYGINKHRGWSVTLNGIVYVQFWPEPVTAVILALWRKWKFSRG